MSDMFTDIQEAPAPSSQDDNSFIDASSVFANEERPQDLKSSERAPVPLKDRASLANMLTLVWGGVGMALVQTGSDIPVGRVMQFQAPMAGAKIEEAIAGTWLDSLLQPLAKGADKVEGLGAIIMFPLLVGAYERNPAIGPMLEPMLRQVIRSSLVDMAPMMKKQKAEEAKAARALAELGEIPGFDKGTDPVDAILSFIFMAPDENQAESTE